jgi:hypothetical protein
LARRPVIGVRKGTKSPSRYNDLLLLRLPLIQAAPMQSLMGLSGPFSRFAHCAGLVPKFARGARAAFPGKATNASRTSGTIR